jgi:hypothetical protein
MVSGLDEVTPIAVALKFTEDTIGEVVSGILAVKTCEPELPLSRPVAVAYPELSVVVT